MPWPAVGGFGLRPPEILRTKNPSSQRRARSPGREKVNYPNEPPERGRINRPPGAIVKAYHLSSPIGNCGPVDAPKLRRGPPCETRDRPRRLRLLRTAVPHSRGAPAHAGPTAPHQ